MQNLILSLSVLVLISFSSFANNDTQSFHLENDEMQVYLEELGIKTEVNETELLNSLPKFDISKIDNSSFKFSFENRFNQPYTLEIFSLNGEKVDSYHFISDSEVTVNKGYLADGEYIYNLYDQFGNFHSGLITY
ncbi:MAG: hypothetical protein EA412_10350 [Chitinophagaceae bacterium]|nr:MAG: hypothetical protein EA412_10350 [Chitinophagaceae bacterium]